MKCESTTPAVTVLNEGTNYRVSLEGRVAQAVIWKRPDLTMQEGADSARELAVYMDTLAKKHAETAAAAIVDLREAPPVAGPVTQSHLAAIMESWEQVGRRVAWIVGESPTQALQIKRLVREHAPRTGAVVTSPAEARAWIAA
jgi:hypothetical protein